MNNKGKTLYIWEAALLMSFCLVLCLSLWAQGRQQSISSSLMRLHVIAVSDDEAEQELKLRVRDAVLGYLEPRLSGAESSAEAQAIIEAELEGIARAAHDAAEGRQVSVSIGMENYPSKSYLGFTLPAGRYNSLRVVLGEGKGQNWWCIAFPPLCLDAAQAEKMQAVMSSGDFAIITEAEGYELRFKIIELWGEFIKHLN